MVHQKASILKHCNSSIEYGWEDLTFQSCRKQGSEGQFLVEIKAKPLPSKGLGLSFDPPDFWNLLRPCLKYGFCNKVISERWNSDQLNTITRYLPLRKFVREEWLAVSSSYLDGGWQATPSITKFLNTAKIDPKDGVCSPIFQWRFWPNRIAQPMRL